jgi:hypothetical protein
MEKSLRRNSDGIKEENEDEMEDDEGLNSTVTEILD